VEHTPRKVPPLETLFFRPQTCFSSAHFFPQNGEGSPPVLFKDLSCFLIRGCSASSSPGSRCRFQAASPPRSGTFFRRYPEPICQRMAPLLLGFLVFFSTLVPASYVRGNELAPPSYPSRCSPNKALFLYFPVKDAVRFPLLLPLFLGIRLSRLLPPSWVNLVGFLLRP